MIQLVRSGFLDANNCRTESMPITRIMVFQPLRQRRSSACGPSHHCGFFKSGELIERLPGESKTMSDKVLQHPEVLANYLIEIIGEND